MGYSQRGHKKSTRKPLNSLEHMKRLSERKLEIDRCQLEREQLAEQHRLERVEHIEQLEHDKRGKYVEIHYEPYFSLFSHKCEEGCGM